MTNDFTVNDIINTKRSLRTRASTAYAEKRAIKEAEEAEELEVIRAFAHEFLSSQLGFSFEEIDAIKFTSGKVNVHSKHLKMTCTIETVYFGFRREMSSQDLMAEAGINSYSLKRILDLEDLGEILEGA